MPEKLQRTKNKLKNVSKEELYDLYVNQQIGSVEIGKKFECSYVSIINKLRKFNIPIRTLSEAGKIVQRDCPAKTLLSKETAIELYEVQRLNISQIAKQVGMAGSAIHNLFKCYGIKTRKSKFDDIKPSKEDLLKLYIELDLSIDKIGKIYHAGESTIYKWIDGYEIPKKLVQEDASEVTCFECGKLFMMTQSAQRARDHCFCSTTCSSKWRSKAVSGSNHYAWKREKHNCFMCNKDIIRTPSQCSERIFCSRACLGEYFSIYRNGENSHSWKGGWKDSYGFGWERAIKLTRRRDSNECQACGRTKEENLSNMNVHHGVPFREFRLEMERLCKEKETIFQFDENLCKRAHDLTNLICLCKNCHGCVETETYKYFQDIGATTIDQMESALKTFPLWQQLKNKEFPYYIPNYQI